MGKILTLLSFIYFNTLPDSLDFALIDDENVLVFPGPYYVVPGECFHV